MACDASSPGDSWLGSTLSFLSAGWPKVLAQWIRRQTTVQHILCLSSNAQSLLAMLAHLEILGWVRRFRFCPLCNQRLHLFSGHFRYSYRRSNREKDPILRPFLLLLQAHQQRRYLLRFWHARRPSPATPAPACIPSARTLRMSARQ